MKQATLEEMEQKAFHVIKENRYYAAFLQGEIFTPLRGNYLGFMYRENSEPKTKWHLDYRFRWYQDEKAFDSDDKRSAYSMVVDSDDSEDQILLKLTELLSMMIPDLRVVWVRGDHLKLIDAMQNDPSMHTRQEK